MKNAEGISYAVADMGAARSTESSRQAFGLGIAAGAYVALAGAAMTIFSSQMNGVAPGINALLSGLVFCCGLTLVLCAGGELFTGNCIMPMGLLTGQAKWGGILKNWVVVYLGNFLGSLIVVALVIAAGFIDKGNSAFSLRAAAIAKAKLALPFGTAFARGILCNWLVALSVWIAMGCDSVTDKIIGLLLPISIFVLSGYEHSVANMYFLPMGIYASSLTAAPLSWIGLVHNLVPVTLGNLVGGMVFVAGLYGWTYKIKRQAQ